jgi:hypothetical protein
MRLVAVKYDDEDGCCSAAGIAVADARDTLSPETHPFDSERRRSPRFAMRKPALLSWLEGGGERVEAVYTTTISQYGCALQGRMFFHPGTRVTLDLAGKTIEGRVVHCLKDHSKNLVTIGLAFDQDGSEFWQVSFDFLTHPM